MSANIFKAGSSRVDITPPLGTRINGDFITHFATTIHDNLYARVLVLNTGSDYLAFVIVDTCIIPQEFADTTKHLISSRTGIPFEHILIASTHTHAAGSLADVHLGSIDMDYARSLPAKILAGVSAAIQNLKPARIGYAAFDAPEHVVCRRYKMKEGYTYLNPVTGKPDRVKTNPIGAEAFIDHRTATPDTELSYLAIQDLEGNWISILANYSLHYVGDWENGTISADYFGYFAHYLENQLDPAGQMTSMMTNGTSGDVNIWDFLAPERYPTELFAKSRLIGEDLAQQLIDSIGDIQWSAPSDLHALYEEVVLHVEKPDASTLHRSAELVGSTVYETIVPDHPDSIRALYAREQLLVEQFPETITCPVQAFRIGNIYVGALAGEFFAETGLALKSKANGKFYFTISMANGNIGYVPPKEQLALGGYETWKCRYRCAEVDSEQIVREVLEKLTDKLGVVVRG
jgi:neutral ceramidase